MITEWTPPVHLPYAHRILYAGNDLMLTQFLIYTLEDCQVIRSPAGSLSRLFIDKLDYSLLLFDEHLPDMTGAELQTYTLTLTHRAHTPVIIFRPSRSYEALARNIKRLLSI